jgi:hypothetical protein
MVEKGCPRTLAGITASQYIYLQVWTERFILDCVQISLWFNMVMFFKCKKVRDYFLKNGLVYTVRRHRYRVGKDWASDGRGKHKICDIFIEEVGPVYEGGIDTLQGYVSRSGFADVSEWVGEIFKLHKSDSLRGFYLYRVEAESKEVY